MKVLHFVPSIDRSSGGVGVYMQLLAKELGKLCELFIVTAESNNPLPVENAQIIVIPTSLLQYRKMRSAWRGLLSDIRPDVVHVNCCWEPQCSWTQKWSQELGYIVVLTPHGMLEPWIIKRHYWTKKLPALLLYQKRAVCKADFLHTTAESEKANLLKLGYNDKISVIPNGIDVERIPLKTDWTRKKRILFLSRLHVKKGVEFLLEAVANVQGLLAGYSVCIAGEGDEEYVRQLKRKVRQLGIEGIVDFCGYVYEDKKWNLFREADLFVLPTYSENFGIVVAEALACGTPVITTKGAPWRDLETYRCGWWTEIGTKATEDALRNFLSLTSDELKTMGRNGRKLVEEKYSARKTAKDMMSLYKSMI